MSIRQLIAPLIDFAYPPRCTACSGATAAGTSGEGDALCGECWAKLELPGHPACALCQRPFEAEHSSDEAICESCHADPPLHDGIAAATVYGEVPRALMLSLKYGGKIALAGPLGRTMASRLPQMDGETLVVPVPVPLHRWRIWKRAIIRLRSSATQLQGRGVGG